MIIIVIAIYILLTLLTLRNPLIGAGTLWIVMWTYPNNLLYGTFPLNVRFDDLYIVITFLSCMAHSRARLTNSPTLLLSFLWLLVVAIGNINGYFYTGGRSLPEITKLVLKATYVPMIAAILLMQVISFKNLRFILKCMLIAGATAAILGICTVLFPEIFQIFLFPDEDAYGTVLNKLELSELIERRARGSVA